MLSRKVYIAILILCTNNDKRSPKFLFKHCIIQCKIENLDLFFCTVLHLCKHLSNIHKAITSIVYQALYYSKCVKTSPYLRVAF